MMMFSTQVRLILLIILSKPSCNRKKLSFFPFTYTCPHRSIGVLWKRLSSRRFYHRWLCICISATPLHRHILQHPAIWKRDPLFAFHDWNSTSPSYYSGINHGGEAAVSSGQTGNSWHWAREWCSHDAYWSLFSPSLTHGQGQCLPILQGIIAQLQRLLHDPERTWSFFFFFLFSFFFCCQD